MIDNNIYCKVSGMVMQCVAQLNVEGCPRPTVIEIGCADGQGVMRYGGFCERVICVDPMVNGRPDIVSSRKEPVTTDEGKLADFRRRTQDFTVHLVQGCSEWPESVAEVDQILKSYGAQADILVVDGCHHPFEPVWADFNNYRGFVRAGGFVIFDDLYEDCILQAYQQARDQGYVEYERWSIRNPDILQDVGALRKP